MTASPRKYPEASATPTFAYELEWYTKSSNKLGSLRNAMDDNIETIVACISPIHSRAALRSLLVVYETCVQYFKIIKHNAESIMAKVGENGIKFDSILSFFNHSCVLPNFHICYDVNLSGSTMQQNIVLVLMLM